MKLQRILVIAASLALFPVLGFAQDTATYMNAELVSADPVRRIVVIRGKGGVETFDLDDQVGSVGPVKPGDRVVLTVHAGVGRRRVTAIAKAASSSGMVITAAPTPRSTTLIAVPATTTTVAVQNKAAAKDAFARQVAILSQDAKPIDSTWASFVTACHVQPVQANDGREWFGLWDNRVVADYSSGQCREMFNQMIQSGEAIKQGMAAAESVALKSLTAGEMRDIRKMNLMDWDGWALPPPPKREP